MPIRLSIVAGEVAPWLTGIRLGSSSFVNPVFSWVVNHQTNTYNDLRFPLLPAFSRPIQPQKCRREISTCWLPALPASACHLHSFFLFLRQPPSRSCEIASTSDCQQLSPDSSSQPFQISSCHQLQTHQSPNTFRQPKMSSCPCDWRYRSAVARVVSDHS